jgi:acetyl-CoA acyltransferase 2
MTVFKNIYVVAAKRTPFGKFGGKLKDLNSTELQTIANKAAIAQSKLPADKIDTVIVGNILHVRFVIVIFDCFRNLILSTQPLYI